MFLYSALIFGIGLCVGSFLNVLIYRLNNGGSPFLGRSHCPKCKHALKWFDLIPLLSFIMLRAKCRYCKKTIHGRYPAVELLTGGLFIGLLGPISPISHISLINRIGLLMVGSSFIIIFFSDLLYGTVPDMAIGLGILGSLENLGRMENLRMGMGAMLFFLILILLSRGKGMGMGDVKLGGLMGIFLGFPKTMVGIWLGFVLGALLAGGLLLFKKKKLKETIPFAPFLIFGTIIAFFWGEKIWHLFIGY